jgi:hypothetical protein
VSLRILDKLNFRLDVTRPLLNSIIAISKDYGFYSETDLVLLGSS